MTRALPTWGTDICPCEHGTCAGCLALKDHQQCSSALSPPRPAPAAYLRSYEHGPVLALVWEAGHDHIWVCTCHLAGHAVVAVQLELFDLKEVAA